jgi:hypothetical protein
MFDVERQMHENDQVAAASRGVEALAGVREGATRLNFAGDLRGARAALAAEALLEVDQY